MTEEVDIEVTEKLEQVESQAYDNEQHLGKRVKIEKVRTMVTDRFKDDAGNPKKSYYVKVESEILDIIDNEQKTEVRASRIFGLTKDVEGKLGWSEKSKLFLFLKQLKVDHPDELVGKEVIVQLTDADRDGFRYCTF